MTSQLILFTDPLPVPPVALANACQCCGDETSEKYPVEVRPCGHRLCTFCAPWCVECAVEGIVRERRV